MNAYRSAAPNPLALLGPIGIYLICPQSFRGAGE